MDYTIEEICNRINKEHELYEDSWLEDGEDIYNFIKFEHNLYLNAYMENKELTREIISLKDELYEYRKKYGRL